ncbi:MAG: T9SS type A sorting domain-containing protein [bacterium]|nr:T9SS type A sorting domain-containing protein [bacterium]
MCATLIGMLLACALSAQNREAQPIDADSLGMSAANDSVLAGSIAPPMLFSAEHFFKETSSEKTITVARSFFGWADNVTGITLSAGVDGEQKLNMVLHLAQDDEDESRIQSEWFTLPTVSDFYCDVVCKGDEATATAYLERFTDGVELALNVFEQAEVNTLSKHAWTLISDPGEQYRLVLKPTSAAATAIEDIGLMEAGDDNVAKETVAGQILDLRRMRAFASSGGEVFIYPNPAQESASIVIDMQTNGDVLQSTLTIVNTEGMEVYSQPCMSTDVILLQTSLLSNGIYAVQVRTGLNRRSTALTIVK